MHLPSLYGKEKKPREDSVWLELRRDWSAIPDFSLSPKVSLQYYINFTSEVLTFFNIGTKVPLKTKKEDSGADSQVGCLDR